jgi:large subunit ribosomal protein L22
MQERKEAKASLKMIRITPRKLRLTANLIRGKKVDHAFKILKFVPRKGARILFKLLKSAVANAETNHEMDVDSLFVHQILVDDGPTWKRIMPRSMGRAYPILKRTSKALIVLREKEEQMKKKTTEAPKTEKKEVKSVSKKKTVKKQETTSAKEE